MRQWGECPNPLRMAEKFAQFGPPAPPGPKVAAVPDSLRNALVSYWKMDGPGASGAWPDSVGGNPLVDHGSVSTVQGIFGDSSRAGLFNASNKRLVAADDPTLRLAYPFTIFLAVTILELPADGVDAWILHKTEEYGLKIVRTGNVCNFAFAVWTDDPPTVNLIDQTLVAGQTYVADFGLYGVQGVKIMPRAPKAPGHYPSDPWHGSTRRRRLGPGHLTWRRGVLERAGYACEWSEDGPRCGAPANQADHIVRGEDAGQALCGPHHAIKSAREGAAARWGRS